MKGARQQRSAARWQTARRGTQTHHRSCAETVISSSRPPHARPPPIRTMGDEGSNGTVDDETPAGTKNITPERQPNREGRLSRPGHPAVGAFAKGHRSRRKLRPGRHDGLARAASASFKRDRADHQPPHYLEAQFVNVPPGWNI